LLLRHEPGFELAPAIFLHGLSERHARVG
jgi:hypothetical protein